MHFREIARRTIRFCIGEWPALYRAEYTQGCKAAEHTVRRARARVGERDYSVITNSAEGFAYWCKTGRGGLLYDDRMAEDKYKLSCFQPREMT